MKFIASTATIIALLVTQTLGNEQDVIKQVGDNLTLRCTVEKVPAKWTFDGNSTQEYVTLEGSGEKYISTLVRSDLSVKDAGIYECFDNEGQKKETSRLTVIAIDGENITISENVTTAEFVCKIDQLNQSGLVESFSWKRGEEVLTNETANHMITHQSMASSLTVSQIDPQSAGLYTCIVEIKRDTEQFEFEHVFSLNMRPDVEPIEKLRSRVEDETATIECKVSGFPVPQITWLVRSEESDTFEPVEYDKRVNSSENSDHVPNAKLIIRELRINTDRGEYMCKAENDVGSNNQTVVLKVKDKLAAVWPFLGIVAEVAILCSIIFIFEKRRSRKMEEEEDVDDAAKQDLMNSANAGDDKEVRQRNNAVKS